MVSPTAHIHEAFEVLPILRTTDGSFLTIKFEKEKGTRLPV
jgi:hypothetical protein